MNEDYIKEINKAFNYIIERAKKSSRGYYDTHLLEIERIAYQYWDKLDSSDTNIEVLKKEINEGLQKCIDIYDNVYFGYRDGYIAPTKKY